MKKVDFLNHSTSHYLIENTSFSEIQNLIETYSNIIDKIAKSCPNTSSIFLSKI